VLNGGDLDPAVRAAVQEWVARVRPAAQIAAGHVRPLAGGYVSGHVDQLTLTLDDDREPLELVRKDASAHEIAGLRAAQALRPDATAIPELVAAGPGWLIIPLAPGSPLAGSTTPPANLFGTLAALHTRFQGDDSLPPVVPRVTPAWWQNLCRQWVAPRLREQAARLPAATGGRAQALIGRAAALPATAAVLAELPPTLLHGDVHPGNVLVHDDHAVLIDWGSARIGPAALDLANLVPAASPGVARYAEAWRQRTGSPLPADLIELGYRWAALQIPVQYLPWTAAYRPAREVEAVLDRMEQALDQLA
jgi:hypothetical protein